MNRQSPPSNSDPKNPPTGFSGPSGFSFGSTAARPPIHKSDSTPSNANGNHEPPANPESPAANLARRKWSGPIAEEAQAHAAAWRATQQIGPRGHSRAHSGEVRIGLHPGAGYSPFPGASPIGSPSFNNGLALPPHGLGRSRNASPNSERDRFVTGSSAPPPQNGLLLSAPTPQNVPAHKRKRSEGYQTLPNTSSQAPSHQAPAPSNPFGGPYQYPQQPQVRPSPSPFPMDHERQSRHGGMGAPNQAPRPLLPPGPGGIPPPDWDAEPNRSRRAYENEMGYHSDNRVRSNSGGNQQTNPLVSPTGMRSIGGGRSNQSMPSTSPQHQHHHHHPSQFHNSPHSHLPHHHHHHQHQSPENAHQSPPTGRHQQHQHSHATHQHPVDSLSSHNHSRSESHGLPLTDKEMQLRAAEEAERKEFAIERERERERVNRMGGGGDYARNAEILTSPSKKTREERERERELMRPENGMNGGGGVGSHPHLLHSQSSIHHQHEHPTNQFQHSHPHHHHHHHQVAPPLPIPHRYSAEDRDRDRERERGATYYPSNSVPSTQTSPVMDRNPNRGGTSVGAIPNPSDPFLPAHHSHSHLHAQHQHPPHHHHHHHHHHHSHQVHHSHPSKDQDPLLRSVDHEIGTRPSSLIAPPLPPPPQISQKFELVEPEPISARRSITPPTQVQPQSPLYSEVKLSHDFNSGPQVNNLPVWEYLEKWKRIDRNPMTNGRPRGGTGGSVSSLQNQVTSAVKKVQEVSEKSKETSTSDGRLDYALEKIKDQVVGGESINSLADELQSLRRNRLEKSGGTVQDSEMQDSNEASSSKQTSSNLKEVDKHTSEKPQNTGKTNQKSNLGDQDEDEEIPGKGRVSSRPDTSNEPSFNRHLGSYRYDPLVQPLLPGQLLASNVGATIEVRIAGETLGPGVGVERMRSSLIVNEEKEEKIKETNEKGKSGKEEEDKMKEKDSETTKSKQEDLEAKKKREEEEMEEIERSKEEKERDWFRSQGRWRLGWRGREFSRSLAADSIESREETTSRPSKRAKLSDATSSSTSKATTASTSQSNTSPYSSALNFWSLRPLVRRKLWGTDVYTDDSDVLAMCVHAGWLEPPILLTRDGKEVPNWVPPGKPARKWLEWDSKEKELEEGGERSNEENGTQDVSMKDLNSTSTSTLGQDQSVIKEQSSDQSTSSWLRSEKERPCDLSVMLRIAPALIAYKGSQRAGIRSRSWGNGHDGVSLYIESVELKEPGYASSSTSSRKSAKARIDHLAKLRLHMAPEIELVDGEKLSLDNHTPQKLVSLDSIFKNHARPSSEKEEKPFWSVKM